MCSYCLYLILRHLTKWTFLCGDLLSSCIRLFLSYQTSAFSSCSGLKKTQNSQRISYRQRWVRVCFRFFFFFLLLYAQQLCEETHYEPRFKTNLPSGNIYMFSTKHRGKTQSPCSTPVEKVAWNNLWPRITVTHNSPNISLSVTDLN